MAFSLLFVLIFGACDTGNNTPDPKDEKLIGNKFTITTDGGEVWELSFAEEEVTIKKGDAEPERYTYTADGKNLVIDEFGTITYTTNKKNGSFSSNDFLGSGPVTSDPPEDNPDYVPSDPDKIEETLDQLLTAGTDYLLAEQYDSALASYEKAYLKAPTNPKAVVYSSLSKLASIAVDFKVKALLQNHLGVAHYPGTLQSLISGNWLVDYPDEYFQWWYWDSQTNRYAYWYGPNPDGKGESGGGSSFAPTEPGYYYGESYFDEQSNDWQYHYTLASREPIYNNDSIYALPELSVPDWLKETEGYTDQLTSKGLESYAAWNMTLFANLLDKNINGLNVLFDDILNSAFGETFEEAAQRIETLEYTDSIALEKAVVEKFGLDDLLEGKNVYIGRAELDLLTASLRLLKASLEWLASYDWTTDLSFLKTDWIGAEGTLNNLKTINISKLPFQNNFLKDRNNGMMAQSKNDYLSAINAAYNAYDHIGEKGDFPPAAKDFLDDYRWIKDGLSKLEAAVKGGTVFYIPEEEPSGGVWPVTEANTLFGIDMGKFFSPGFFSPENIFILKSPGVPEFYGFTSRSWTWGDNGFIEIPEQQVKIENLTDFNTYDSFGLALKTDRIRELIKGMDSDIEEDISYLRIFPRDAAEILYKRYNGLQP
jgi:hypothetical protein